MSAMSHLITVVRCATIPKVDSIALVMKDIVSSVITRLVVVSILYTYVLTSS